LLVGYFCLLKQHTLSIKCGQRVVVGHLRASADLRARVRLAQVIVLRVLHHASVALLALAKNALKIAHQRKAAAPSRLRTGYTKDDVLQ